ncbi:MAG: agmatinase [bacterium]
MEGYFSPPFGFGGLEEGYTDYRRAGIAVLPVPYDATVSYGTGTRNGPRHIISASMNLELYDVETGRQPFLRGIHTLPEVEPVASGPQSMVNRVYTICRGVLRDGKFPVILGGEHSISFGVVRALRERYADLSVLQLDAHADLREEYGGTPYNHACVMRRILDICPIVQVGIRSMSPEEAKFIRERDLRPFYAHSMISGGDDWMGEAVRRLTDMVYITIDLDALDPSIMPAVGTPEPGGMGWYEVIALIRRVAESKRIVGFDVLELAPQPGNIAPDFLAAKLVYKVLAYIDKNFDMA